MEKLWRAWVGDQPVEQFLGKVDAAIKDGVYPDRWAAFLEFARNLGSHAGADLDASELAAHLLSHAEESERKKAWALA